MGTVVRFEPCPKCREQGRDRAGDNLGCYSDGSAHCFSCGYHRFVKGYIKKEPKYVNENQAVLPADFTRDIPADAWRWVLQYGLSYSYWKKYCGYSESTSRLVFTVGDPPRFSIGRYIGNDAGERAKTDRTFRKWTTWGDRGEYTEFLGRDNPGEVALVEDLISAHKVSQITPCIPLFGTRINDATLRELREYNRPVVLWLDADQKTLLIPKVHRLQFFLEVPIRTITTSLDPKYYSLSDIKEILE
jgi:hypothetical protein